MFSGITEERLLNMSAQEQRWLNNVKKAFFESDRAFADGRAEGHCLPELCKAIDTAKTLRRSLLGEDTSPHGNKRRFIEFLNLEVPEPNKGGVQVRLRDARTGAPVVFSFAELVYDIRCMVHENENLNAVEGPDYHILIDWRLRSDNFFGTVSDGRLKLNGFAMWSRMREVVAKFVTGMDGLISLAKGGGFRVSCAPAYGSIRPQV